MSPSPGMDIRFARLLAYDAVLVGLVGGCGAYPTWYWSGWAGVLALPVAAGMLLAASLTGGFFILAAATEGPARAAAAFMPAEGYRIGISIVLTAVAALAGVAITPLLVWVMIFFLVTLYCEVVWLVKALRKAQLTDADWQKIASVAGLFSKGRKADRQGDQPEIDPENIDWDDL